MVLQWFSLVHIGTLYKNVGSANRGLFCVCVDPLPLFPNRRLDVPDAPGGPLPLASNRILEVPKAVFPFCARGGPLSLAPNRRLEVAQAVDVLYSGC